MSCACGRVKAKDHGCRGDAKLVVVAEHQGVSRRARRRRLLPDLRPHAVEDDWNLRNNRALSIATAA